LGNLLINSIRQKDIPVVMGATIFMAAMFSLIMLIVDILYALVDPRIKSKYTNMKWTIAPKKVSAPEK
jgi:peptide/nickel transport system permease protein